MSSVCLTRSKLWCHIWPIIKGQSISSFLKPFFLKKKAAFDKGPLKRFFFFKLNRENQQVDKNYDISSFWLKITVVKTNILWTIIISAGNCLRDVIIDSFSGKWYEHQKGIDSFTVTFSLSYFSAKGISYIKPWQKPCIRVTVSDMHSFLILSTTHIF